MPASPPTLPPSPLPPCSMFTETIISLRHIFLNPTCIGPGTCILLIINSWLLWETWQIKTQALGTLENTFSHSLPKVFPFLQPAAILWAKWADADARWVMVALAPPPPPPPLLPQPTFSRGLSNVCRLGWGIRTRLLKDRASTLSAAQPTSSSSRAVDLLCLINGASTRLVLHWTGDYCKSQEDIIPKITTVQWSLRQCSLWLKNFWSIHFLKMLLKPFCKPDLVIIWPKQPGRSTNRALIGRQWRKCYKCGFR